MGTHFWKSVLIFAGPMVLIVLGMRNRLDADGAVLTILGLSALAGISAVGFYFSRESPER